MQKLYLFMYRARYWDLFPKITLNGVLTKMISLDEEEEKIYFYLTNFIYLVNEI